MSATVIAAPAPRARRLHPWPVRAMHWLNAVAMIAMIGSGWGIYDDAVVFHFVYFWDGLKLGSWAAESLLYHFAFMWLLMINGAVYLVYGFATGRFRERLLPIRPAEIVETVRDTLHLRIAHEDLTVYNAVQKLLYIIVILAGIAQVATGLALWKPTQFSGLIALFVMETQQTRSGHTSWQCWRDITESNSSSRHPQQASISKQRRVTALRLRSARRTSSHRSLGR